MDKKGKAIGKESIRSITFQEDGIFKLRGSATSSTPISTMDYKAGKVMTKLKNDLKIEAREKKKKEEEEKAKKSKKK